MHSTTVSWLCFNSLQTGKRIWTGTSEKGRERPSRFNSLQTGKRIWTKMIFKGRIDRISFNSLQTGKRIWTKFIRKEKWMGHKLGFNSLQTGKRIWTNNQRADGTVLPSGFNSLQTGKRIWTQITGHRYGLSIAFQFPSNGKAYLNLRVLWVTLWVTRGFNSLQTGKRIWTWPETLNPKKLKNCFNSLQTGKRIWTVWVQVLYNS